MSRAGVAPGCALALLAAALAACSTAPSPANHATAAPPTAPLAGGAPCGASQLQVALVSDQGVAGMTTAQFEVRNAGRQACTLTGFPTVAMVDASGGAVPTATTNETSPPPSTVALPAGTAPLRTVGATGHAWFTLSFDDNTCPATPADIPVRWRFGIPDSGATVDASSADAAGSPPLVCGGAVVVRAFQARAQ